MSNIEEYQEVASCPEPVQPPKGRFIINLPANMASYMVNIIIGLWYISFLIKQLGTEAYGLIPLATTTTSYIG